MDNDLAYLCGAYFGDGHIYYRHMYYQFSVVSSDKDLCDICSCICLSHFGNAGRVFKVMNYYKLVVCSKQLCDYILEQFCTTDEFFTSDRYQRKGFIPPFSDSEKKHFIAGLMDSDGCISKKKNGKYIKYDTSFGNTSLLTPEIYKIMIDIGLDCGKLIEKEGTVRIANGKVYNKSKNAFTWSINTNSYASVGFRVKRKQDLLNECITRKKD